MQIVVVQDQVTEELIPFTLSLLGEIIITTSGAVIDNLVVKTFDTRDMSEVWLEDKQDYYVFLRRGE